MSATRLVLTIAVLLSTPGAGAQPVERVPTVQVDGETVPEAAAGHGEDARDPTHFTTVIRPDDTLGAAPEVGELVEPLSGVNLRREGGSGRAQRLQIRGAAGHQIAVFLDGIPLTGGRGAEFDFATIPAAYLDRVEVLRGPAAALYGSGAQGGVVHLRTRAPGPGWGASASLRGGALELWQGDTSLAWAGDDVDVFAAGTFSRAGGAFDYTDTNGRGRTRVNNDHQRIGGLARVRGRIGRSEATGLVEVADVARGEPGVEQFPSDTASSAQRRIVAAARLVDDGLWGGRVAVDGLAHARRSQWRFDEPDPVTEGPAETFESRDTALGGRLLARWQGSDWHAPSVAAEGQHEGAQTDFDAFDRVHRDETRGRWALVAADEVYLLDDALTLAGALRLDDTDDRAPIAVPKGGVAWRPHDAVTLRANAGRIFRDPSFDELYFRGANLIGNPDLRPEDGWSWDVGLQLAWGERAALEAVWFDAGYERVILFLPKTPYTVEATDAFGARSRGAELSGALRWAPLRIDASYTFVDARFDTAGRDPLPFRPRHRVAARAAVGGARWQLDVASRWRGEVTTDAFGLRTIPGHVLWDAGARLRLSDDFTLGLEVRNALDVRDALDAVQRPMPGRVVFASLRYDAQWSGAGDTP